MTIKETFLKNLSKIRGNTPDYKLADIIQCSKGTISKYLNAEQYPDLLPPFDGIYRICTHFKVSIDWLMGIDKKMETSETINIKELCSLISTLLESDKCKFQNITYKEECWEQYETDNNGYCEYSFAQRFKSNKYTAVFFPDYKTSKTEDDLLEFEQIGNLDSKNYHINNFIQKMLKANSLYKENGIDKEMYHDLIEKYISDLPDE